MRAGSGTTGRVYPYTRSSSFREQEGIALEIERSHNLDDRIILDTSEEKPAYLLIGKNRSYIRLSPKAYGILQSINSGLSYEALADRLSQQESRKISSADVESAYKQIENRIKEIESRADDNPRGFWLRFQILPEKVVAAISRYFQILFHPVMAFFLIGIIFFAVWIALKQNLFAGLINSIGHNPSGFWFGYALFFISIIFHEFGHASACAYFGAKPSGIGFTTYLIYPALYSDVSSAWQLKRLQRVVVDLGGIFFQLIVGSVYIFLYQVYGWESLKIAFVMILGNCAFSLNPILKFDGYWVIADALGVVNLSSQPSRIVKHLLDRLHGRQVKPLPWRTSVTLILAIYSVVSFLFWAYFLLAVFPLLWQQIINYPARLSAAVTMLSNSSQGLQAKEIHLFFISTYMTFLTLFIVYRLSRPAIRSIKPLLLKLATIFNSVETENSIQPAFSLQNGGNSNGTFKKTSFWIALAFVSIGGIFFVIKYFHQAFPVVNLSITMDREAALESASELARLNNWKPEGYRQAASFLLDNQVQNYVELEAGGSEAFSSMLKDWIYSPYTWLIRHFKDGDTHEIFVWFTPEGKPYSFIQRLPESEAGTNLTSDFARELAEKTASEKWGIVLSDYLLVEKSQQSYSGGRIDHTFVYERLNEKIGEGRYRLLLKVSGDKLSEVRNYVKIPEAFSRRYQEMRSINKGISTASQIAVAILYFIGGCAFGILFLLRRRLIIWRKPLFFGILIALLQLLSGVNQLPLAWMSYDTALSSQGFLMQRLIGLFSQFVALSLLLTVSFIAAEGLTRRAFPYHIQLWRLWSPSVASSKEVLGRTVGGYLLVSLFFVYEVALYFIANRTMGWWSPSDTLLDPNKLATYLPWFSSIATSFQAAFWEESIFRAIPIAGAALLGEKFGKRRLFILGAILLQAVIFGSGHASYANQPAYARVVELIIPSLAFGVLYIYFGLLPAVILHFAYDVIWISLPLFISSTPGIWTDRAIVILLALIPLWVVLLARMRAGKWTEIDAEYYNGSWAPPTKEEPEESITKVSEPVLIHPKTGIVILIGGILSLLVWTQTTAFHGDVPPLTITRNDAELIARNTLSQRGILLSPSWKTLSMVLSEPDDRSRFVWQNSGREAYNSLFDSCLLQPMWRVRFVRFEVDVVERAEEYQVFISSNGKVERVKHQLPETRTGKTLTEEEARQLADYFLRKNYQLDPDTLKQVLARPSKLFARQDWEFTFSEPSNALLKNGETRIALRIAGDEVVDAFHYIHAPEEWFRNERDRRNLPKILENLIKAAILLLLVVGVVAAVTGWGQKRFNTKVFLSLFTLFMSVHIINLLNKRSSMMAAQFSTAQSYLTQYLTVFGFEFLIGMIICSTLALLAGFAYNRIGEKQSCNYSGKIIWGISLGTLMAGLSALTGMFAPSLAPSLAGYNTASVYLPALGGSINAFIVYALKLFPLLFMLETIDYYTGGWRKRKVLFAPLFLFAGLIFTGWSSIETIPFWLLSGLVTGIFLQVSYIFVFRFYPALLPIAIAVPVVLDQFRQAISKTYPVVFSGAFATVLILSIAVFYLYGKMIRSSETQAGSKER
jgi:hypothetical protein